MKMPIILITSDCLTLQNETFYAVPAPYAKAIASFEKLIPFALPPLAASLKLENILDTVGGLLITGAKSNIDPIYYGKPHKEDQGPFDRQRDETNLALINLAIKKNIPILGICRGLQELNVALGGTLQHAFHKKKGYNDHRAKKTTNQDERFALSHDVKLVSGGKLEKILNCQTIKVNSLHEQAIEILAPSLQAEAYAEDGIIEAVSLKDTNNFVLGLQWHPEYWLQSDKNAQKIFLAFEKAVLNHIKNKAAL